jgi:hypothetical protein
MRCFLQYRLRHGSRDHYVLVPMRTGLLCQLPHAPQACPVCSGGRLRPYGVWDRVKEVRLPRLPQRPARERTVLLCCRTVPLYRQGITSWSAVAHSFSFRRAVSLPHAD